MTEPGTAVSVGTERPHARLAALVVDVMAVVRVTDPLTGVPAAQPISALPHAAALRRLVEVLRGSRLDLRLVRMILTGQAKRLADDARLLGPLRHLAPQIAVSRQVLEVADDVEAHLGARQRHADSIFVADETDVRFRLLTAAAAAAHERQQDDVVLFSLVVVDRTEAHVVQRGTLTQQLTNEEHLTRVWSQDRYLYSSSTRAS